MTEPATNVAAMPALREATAVMSPGAQPLTPMQMLSTAITNGASIELLEKLMTLQERWQANQARQAFDAAIAAAKAEIKPVRKNRSVGYVAKGEGGGRVDYVHEDMGEIARSVDPILAKHGLSYRFRTAQINGAISVTTVVTHRDGHFEETVLSAAPDKSGKKNDIQAIGSAITYLQRYGIKAALGLAASADDDGKATGATGDAETTISAEQVAELEKLAEEVGANKDAFFNYAKIESFADILVKHFARAKRDLEAVRHRKAKEAEKPHARD
jgi:hypothetical protein